MDVGTLYELHGMIARAAGAGAGREDSFFLAEAGVRGRSGAEVSLMMRREHEDH